MTAATDGGAGLPAAYAQARTSESAWDAFVSTLRSGPGMDRVVAEATGWGRYGPPAYSTDPWTALGHALMLGCSVMLDEDERSGDGETRRVILEGAGHRGVGTHAWPNPDGDTCACSGADPFDLDACRAYTVCLALLDMYSPTRAELGGAAPSGEAMET